MLVCLAANFFFFFGFKLFSFSIFSKSYFPLNVVIINSPIFFVLQAGLFSSFFFFFGLELGTK